MSGPAVPKTPREAESPCRLLPGERFVTFGFVYSEGEIDECMEEMDFVVRSTDDYSPSEYAADWAAENLEPGWTRIRHLPAGGTGGLVMTLEIQEL